jgi:hypothetical protein
MCTRSFWVPGNHGCPIIARRQGTAIDLRFRVRKPQSNQSRPREALRDQPLKFDRADFRANPFRLRTPLRGSLSSSSRLTLRVAMK